MRAFFIVLISCFFLSCSSSKVFVDYDESTDFTRYKTYQFYEDAGKEMSEFDVKRTRKSIQETMDSLKLQMSDQSPDFFINFSTRRSAPNSSNAVGVGIAGGSRGGVSISTSVFLGSRKIEEQMLIEFVDAKSDELFWQGQFKLKIAPNATPQEREAWIKQVVQKIIFSYSEQLN